MAKSKKTNDPIPKKCLDKQRDGQTLFYRLSKLPLMGPTSTSTADWHLKVKNTDYNVSLTKNYCITTSMPKISSIHELTLQIQ